MNGEAPTPYRDLVIVGIGGAIGALLRWSLGEIAPGWPWPTYVVNVLGSFLLGALPLAGLQTRRRAGLLIGPGVLGGFTSLSAYADEIRNLIASGRIGLGLTYAIATVVCCLVAAWLGRQVLARVLATEVGQ